MENNGLNNAGNAAPDCDCKEKKISSIFSLEPISSAKLWKLYETAEKTRQFEIELLWKRSSFFWVINAAMATALYKFYDKSVLFYKLLFVCLGAIASLSWLLVTMGSKYWQSEWEHKVECLEDALGIRMYRMRSLSREAGILGNLPFSVSKINTMTALIFFLVWIMIFFKICIETVPQVASLNNPAIVVVGLGLFLFAALKLLLCTKNSNEIHRIRCVDIREKKNNTQYKRVFDFRPYYGKIDPPQIKYSETDCERLNSALFQTHAEGSNSTWGN